MAILTLRKLLEAGVHFGHQTKRWNPKMKKYIFGERNNIYIIDLQKTLKLFHEAYNFVKDLSADGGRVLFVGTKKQAQQSIQEESARCGGYYVTHRWLGGMMTNFSTIKKSVEKLKSLEEMHNNNNYEKLTKKEILKLEKYRLKLDRNLSGIKNMERLPDALFVVDPRRERIGILEAKKLSIPVIAIVDTNCDPDNIDFVIPGNDDAIRAIRLISSKISDAVIEGQNLYRAKLDIPEEKEAAPIMTDSDFTKIVEEEKVSKVEKPDTGNKTTNSAEVESKETKEATTKE